MALFLSLMSHDWTPWVLSALILIGGLIPFLYWRNKIAHLRRQVSQLRQHLEETRTPGNLSSVSAIVQELELQEPWDQYAQSLHLPNPLTDAWTPWSARSASQSFAPGLLASRLNVRLLLAWPNYLVGAGLLCTFLGLIAALYFASAGVAASDVQQSQAALRQLLHAATFKFMTSLVGLGASIAFSWFEKYLLHGLNAELARLALRLDKLFPPKSAEVLLFEAAQTLREGFDRNERLSQDQLATLKGFSTDLAVSLSQALEQRLEPHFKGVAGSIDGLGERFLTLNSGAMEQTVSSFGETLRASSSKEMEQFRQMISTLASRLEQSADSLQQQQLQLVSQLGVSLSGLSGVLQQGGQQLAQNIQESGRASEQVMNDMLDRLRGSLEVMEKGMLAASRAFESQVQLGAQQSAGFIQDAGKQLLSGMSEVESSLKAGTVRCAQELEEASKRSSQALDAVVQTFAGTVSQLGGTTSRMQTLLSDATTQSHVHQTQLGGTLEHFQTVHRQLGETLEKLTKIGPPLQTSTMRMQQTAEVLKQVSNLSPTLLQGLTALPDKAQEQLVRIEGVANALKQSWIDYEKRFQAVDKDLERAFTQLQTGTDAYTRQVQTFFLELDKNMAKATSTLASQIDGLNENVEALTDTLSKQRLKS